MKIKFAKISLPDHETISIHNIIYSPQGHILKYDVTNKYAETQHITYSYLKNRIIKNVSGATYLYSLANGKVSQAKIGESLLTFKYSGDRLIEIERISGDEITKAVLVWDTGNVIEIHTDDNYLGDNTMLIHPSKQSNPIGIIPSLLKSEFHHEIDFALMSAGYFGKCDKLLPETISYYFGENDTSDILQVNLSYNFDSQNRVTIQSHQSSDDSITIEFVRR